jgi:hypothetical protein
MLRAVPQLLGLALAAAAWLLACGSEPSSTQPPPRGPGFFAAALASVEKTPDLLRQELLKTCDKWRHLDRPCDEEAVRRDVLECWVDKGERIFAWTEGRKMRPRASYLRTLLEVNICMESRRWRKIKPGSDF